MSGLEALANTWLAEAPWQKVFKHTLDVLQDYVSNILVTVGAIALSVRLLTTLSTGDLSCILIGVVNGTNGSLNPYPSSGGTGMINYAQTQESCIRSVFTYFMEYLPYIMLLQSVILIIVDKFTFKIPRIAQKVERFYKNIVEDSLFGKDPDVSEDLTDPKTSTESVSRMRQRNEICVSLKRSSIIHHVYIGKNIVEFFVVCAYLPIDIYYALKESERDDSSKCTIPILSFPEVHDDADGDVLFQCKGKKQSFFMLALWIQIILLGIHLILSVGRLIWCFRFRSVSLLLDTIETMRKKWEPSSDSEHTGQDFLFLFDLLAHSCGLEATLRVLSHSDEHFAKMCTPSIPEGSLKLEEDKVKVSWQPADIERWLHAGARKKRYKSIAMESYEVTIFPAETVKRTKTIPVVPKMRDLMIKNGECVYSTWFFDLSGGKTEYVITIATMIGKSRMKGAKVVSNLVPYGPEKPRTGMLKTAGTNQVEIFWDPPKGEFTKYVLSVEKAVDKPVIIEPNFLRMTSTKGLADEINDIEPTDAREIDLSFKLTTYTILGLDPGEKYNIKLATKTGLVSTRQAVTDIVMTKPLPVAGFMADEVTTNSCVLHWLIPSGHPCLKGFQIKVLNHDGKLFKDFAVSKTRNNYNVSGLIGGYDYEIKIIALCVFDNQRTESEPEVVNVTTLPECVKNFRLEHVNTHTMVFKWDLAPPPGSHIVRQKLTIEGVDVQYSNSVDLTGDKSQYTFGRLPDPEGSGRQYRVSIAHTLNTIKENEVQSAIMSDVFATPPHRPSSLAPGRQLLQMVWSKSATPHVTGYRVRWKPLEEGSSEGAKDEFVPTVDEEWQGFSFPTLAKEVVYKVTVASVVELGEGRAVESKEVGVKVVWKENKGLVGVDD